jgi:hypothetical protein
MRIFTPDEIQEIQGVIEDTFAKEGRYPVVELENGTHVEVCEIQEWTEKSYFIVTQDVGCSETDHTGHHLVQPKCIGMPTMLLQAAVRMLLHVPPRVATGEEIADWMVLNTDIEEPED